VFSASTDKTAGVWDAEAGVRIRRLRGHTSFVNTCAPAKDEPSLVTGSDDGTVKIWDTRRRNYVHSLANKYQVTAACYGGSSNQIITGGLDNVIKVWDVRKLAVEISLEGHTDTVTSLSLSPNGNHVLSNAMDNSVRMWDVRFVTHMAFPRTLRVSNGSFYFDLISRPLHFSFRCPNFTLLLLYIALAFYY
jgi:Prp8 binding protein